MTNTKLKFYSLLALIAIILISALISIDKVILDNHHIESRQQVRDDLNHISNRLTFNLYNNIQVVKGLPTLFIANPSLPQQEFTPAVEHLFDEHTQLRNIAAAPDLVIKYMYPIKGNEAAMGLDYRTLPLQLPSVIKAKESRQLVLAGPLTLVQGGTGIISRIPVYLNKPTGEEYFWGIISAVIDADRLYQNSGLMSTELPIEIAIRGKDGLGQMGDVFWGSPRLFDQDNIRATITLPSGSWELVAKPINGWSPEPEDMLQKRLVTYGIALTLFLIMFAFFKATLNTLNANIKFRTLFDSSPDAIIISSTEGKFIDGNKASLILFGCVTVRELCAKKVTDISPPKQPCGTDSMALAKQHIAMTIKKGNHHFEWVHKRLNTNEEFPCDVLLNRVITDGKMLIQATVRDITHGKLQQERLELMAHYDVLTKLPNRTLFAVRFNQAVAHSKRTERQLAVCFLDLDNFKPINDNYGHDVGDEILIKVAKRIKECLREEDTVSRQGGDEFTLLLNDIENYAQCDKTLGRVHHAIAQLYSINGISHYITASSGITLYPADNADIDTLIRHADQAMYQAKLLGKNRYQLFNPQDDEHIIQTHHQLAEIKQALANNEFQLYYQPKVNMRTGKVFGVEALIRWFHPEKGLIPPLDFLPLLEGTEVEMQIGGWVINEALQQLDDWQQQGIKLEVSINISSHHLQSDVFFDQLNDALDRHPDVDSQDIQLEILESSALGDINAISGIITSCQNVFGVNVALDDFGTGYSSLTHMKNLSAGTIKIDQTFVRDLLDDPDDYSIIEGIIGLAKAFNRDVIAEGVETDSHGLMLLMMGCNDAQGYGISRPIPADDLVSWLADYTPNKHWLDYDSRYFTLQEQKIVLLRLTTEHWFNNVKNTLLTTEDGNFGYRFMKCHLGAWFTRFEQDKTFKKSWLTKLRLAHDVMFALAKELVDKHQAGETDAARDRLDDLKLLYENVRTILEGYAQNNVAKKAFANMIKKS